MELKQHAKENVGVKSLHGILLLSIWLMTLMIIFSSMYYEHMEQIPVYRYVADTQQTASVKEISQKGNNVTNSPTNRDYGVRRLLLTKTDYPITLTAPFTMENPQICDGNVTVLIVVKSSPNHFYKRSLLRQSFGNVDLFKRKYNVRIAFLLGLSESRNITETIKLENELYRDIIQAQFTDAYRNLTLKGVMAFRWISKYCSHAELVIKMDDDVFINIFQILEVYLPRLEGRKNLILCNKMYPSEVIRYKSKWKVNDDFFRRQKYFPPYCSGFTAIFSTDTVKALYQAAHFTPFFWVDDVYLTGLLPSKYNISLDELNNNASLDRERCYADYNSTSPTLISCGTHYEDDFYYFWASSLTTLTSTMKIVVNETFLNEKLIDRINNISYLLNWI